MSIYKKNVYRAMEKPAKPSSVPAKQAAARPFFPVRTRDRGRNPKPEEKNGSVSATDFYFLLEHTPDIIALLTSDREIRYYSSASERVLGYQPREVLGKNLFVSAHQEDTLAAAKTVQLISLTLGVARTLEFRGRHREVPGCQN